MDINTESLGTLSVQTFNQNQHDYPGWLRVPDVYPQVKLLNL